MPGSAFAGGRRRVWARVSAPFSLLAPAILALMPVPVAAQALPNVPRCAGNDAGCLARRAVAREARAAVYDRRAAAEREAAARDRAQIARMAQAAAPQAVAPTPTAATPGAPIAGATPLPAIPYRGDRAAAIEPYAAPGNDGDGYGAFRVTCIAAHLGQYDPIVYPGQARAGHLHQFYGNIGVTGASTYASLRAEVRPSTCGGVLNQSAYWMPALMNGAGGVVRPDFITLYYKRWPRASVHCTDGREAPGGCAGIPTGLRYLAGYDMLRMGEAQPRVFDHASFYCIPAGRFDAPGGKQTSMAAALNGCRAGDQLFAQITFPDCWDGRNLDSADHRSHTAYGSYRPEGGYACPASHPVAIPVLSQIAAFTVDGNAATWHLASDRMPGHNMAAGSTFHADYFEGWDEATRLTWERNCIDTGLSCSYSNLGDGTRMRNPPGFSFTAEPHVVPVP